MWQPGDRIARGPGRPGAAGLQIHRPMLPIRGLRQGFTHNLGGTGMSESQEKQRGPSAAANPGLLSAVQTWGLYNLIMGLASDFLSPLGPVAPVLLCLFIILGGAGFYLSRNKPATLPWSSHVMKFSLVGTAVFAVVIGLQMTTAKQDADGNNIGIVASYVPGVAAVQSAVLPVEAEPKDEYEAAMRAALRARDDAERGQQARLALSSEDATFRQTAAERFYLSGQPVLRRQAILSMLAARGRTPLPILVIEAEDNDPALANQMMGRTVTFGAVDTATGALRASAMNRSTSGTVNQSGVSLTVTGAGAFDLQSTDDFNLEGTYRNNAGESVRVRLSLN